MVLDRMGGTRLSKGHDIARKQNITDAYFEQIMIPLKRSGIVETVRGCNGGYELGRDPEEITVLDVIELFDGDFNFSTCLRRGKECSSKMNCPTAPVWDRLGDVMRKEARNISLGSIVGDFQEKLSGDYSI